MGAYEAWAAGHDISSHDSLEPSVADEATVRKATVAGTPEEVASQLRPLVEAFGGRQNFDLIVGLHYPGMDFGTAARATELFGEQVIGALKGS